jgi:hypothetical protein
MTRQTIEGLPEQPEQDFQEQLIELLVLNGWPRELIYHALRSEGSRAGFPDIVAVKPSARRLLIAELKRDSGKLSADQQRWIDALQEVRYFDAKVWRPRDLDEIARFAR